MLREGGGLCGRREENAWIVSKSFFLEKHDLMEPQLASHLLEQRVILNFLPF